MPQFISRLETMRQHLGSAADRNLFVDTRASGRSDLLTPIGPVLCSGLCGFAADSASSAGPGCSIDPVYTVDLWP